MESPSEHSLVSFPSEQAEEFSERDQQVFRLCKRGFRVFPCRPHAKEPAIGRWNERATDDLAQVLTWLESFPESNWGLATGSKSGVFVLDVDGEPGLQSFSTFLREHSETSTFATLGVKTGSGSHLYFEYPKACSVRNSARKIAPGLDIRGEGGYVIVPPSTHPNGTDYRWLGDNEDAPIASAPYWLLDQVAQAMPGRVR